MFRNMIFSAVIAGVLAGLLLSAVQRLQVVPIIFEAEAYEMAEETVAATSTDGHSHSHSHSHSHEAAEEEGWAPEDGKERTNYTVLANILAGIGFSLLLAAAIMFKNRSGLKNGLLWGLGGYVAFFVAPSLGLLPEIPGTVTADLASRQIWWGATVMATIAGLGVLVFSEGVLMKGIGVILLVVPHLVGAPHPAEHSSLAPESLTHAFVQATAVANGVFWVVLGGLTGLFLQKMSGSES